MSGNEADFWQKHSLNFLEMAFRTDRRQRLASPDGHGLRKGECGDTIEIFLNVEDGRIGEACFDSDGCLNTIACANTILQLAEGKTLAEAWKITPETVADFLETLPANESHCAELAAGALYLALSDAEKKGPAPRPA